MARNELRVDKTRSSKSSVRGFLGLVSFSTILPLNIHTTIEEMARFTWLWPIIGGFIGILVGLLGYVGSNHHIPTGSRGHYLQFRHLVYWFPSPGRSGGLRRRSDGPW